MPGLRRRAAPRLSLRDQWMRHPAMRGMRPRSHRNVQVRSRGLLHRGLFLGPAFRRLLRLSPGAEPVLRREFAHSVDFIRNYRRDGKLLELGAAYGFFLMEAARYFDVAGIE